MLLRREVYNAVGGHQAIKGDIIEYLALARNMKRAGFRLLLADGRALVSTRMYASLREIWEGWSKNMCTADTGQPQAQRLAMYALYGFLSVAPFVLLLWSAAAFTMAPHTLVAIAGVQSAAQAALILALRVKINELFRVGPRYALAHPLAGAIFLGMMAGCGLRALARRGVRWKGRKY